MLMLASKEKSLLDINPLDIQIISVIPACRCLQS